MSQATKYNYLQHSFQKQLQRSYDRNQRFSPPSLNSPSVSIKSPTNKNVNYRQRSIPRSSQFSPYQNKQQNIKDKILVQQLKNHNKVLTQQIQQYKTMLDKLQTQLRLRTDQFANLDMLRQKQRLLNEQATTEMKEQIAILLTKNTYLEDKNIVLQAQLKKYQTQLTKNQARTRSLSTVAANSKLSSEKLVQQINSLLQKGVIKPKKKQRDNGKLLNQTFSNVESSKHSPRNISSPLNSNSQNMIIEQIQSLLRRQQKYQQFIQSILEMHHKISGKTLPYQPSCSNELKNIWKWLKQLGHNYNITQKWKKMLMDVLGLSKKCQAQDMSIDDVLQKTIVELHAK